jgi:hypothetical protein
VFKFSTRHSSVALDRYKRLKRRHFVQQAGQAKRLQDEAAREEAASTLLTLAAGEPRFSDKGKLTPQKC